MSFTKRIPIEQRFRKHFVQGEQNECWNWTGGRSSDGYGRIGIGGRTNKKMAAHRLAWKLTNGPILNGLHCLHRCDNPSCVNPAHLWLGTNLENMQDRDRKGRCKARGWPGQHARLTPRQVLEIRKRGSTQENLAKKYRVARSTIANIQTNRIWKQAESLVKTIEGK